MLKCTTTGPHLKNILKHVIPLTLFAVLVLSACQPVIPTPLPNITLPAPTLSFSDFPAAAEAARADVARTLNLPVEDVSIERVVPSNWSDSCLGLGGPEESCLQVVTAGYLVKMDAGGVVYEYRTDIQGNALRSVPAGQETPAAVYAAIDTLAAQLGLDPSLISLNGSTAVEWPNSCLGVVTADTACAEVITPGYQVRLVVGAATYLLNTNQDGSQVVLAPAESSQFDQPVIILQTSAEGGCREVQVTPLGVGSGECGGSLEIKAFPGMQRSVELDIWLARYAPFEINAVDGSLTFKGRGTQTAITEEQRAMIAWVQLALLDVQDTPADPTTGLLIDWTRTGGLAGVCDRLLVFESGFAYTRNCSDTALGQTLLQTGQIQLLYNWRDTLKSTLASASEGVTDGFQYDLKFTGGGTQVPDAEIKQAMFIFAAQIYSAIAQ